MPNGSYMVEADVDDSGGRSVRTPPVDVARTTGIVGHDVSASPLGDVEAGGDGGQLRTDVETRC